jgi:hypothetical protein
MFDVLNAAALGVFPLVSIILMYWRPLLIALRRSISWEILFRDLLSRGKLGRGEVEIGVDKSLADLVRTCTLKNWSFLTRLDEQQNIKKKARRRRGSCPPSIMTSGRDDLGIGKLG